LDKRIKPRGVLKNAYFVKEIDDLAKWTKILPKSNEMV
jgi:hypothetical protein